LKLADEHNAWEQERRLYLTNGAANDRQASSNSEIPMAKIMQTPSLQEHDWWGHPLSSKPHNTIRILLQNISSIGIHHHGSANWQLSMIS